MEPVKPIEVGDIVSCRLYPPTDIFRVLAVIGDDAVIMESLNLDFGIRTAMASHLLTSLEPSLITMALEFENEKELGN